MLKFFTKIRKSVMLWVKALIVCSITFTFIETWVTSYTTSLFSRDGNFLLIFSFVFMLILFGSLFSAFKIGIYRLSEIVYSLSLSILITNFIMYLELSLIAREMLNPLYLIISMIIEMVIGLIGAICANTVYFKLYPPKELLAIFGDDQSGFRLITKMNLIHQRFKIMRGINGNTESFENIIDTRRLAGNNIVKSGICADVYISRIIIHQHACALMLHFTHHCCNLRRCVRITRVYSPVVR